jgi:hypothetical protein
MAWQARTAPEKKYNSKAITLFSPFFRKIITHFDSSLTVISKEKSSLDILSISLIMGVEYPIGLFMYSVEWVRNQKSFSELFREHY